MDDAVISLRYITKSFGGPLVLDAVSIQLYAGETHILAGENGAGKSTLMRILGGIVSGFSGEILVNGVRSRFRGPNDAASKGIAMIHQELSLVPSMSVIDNLLLGIEPNRLGFRGVRAGQDFARKLLARVGLTVDLNEPVQNLPLATCQLLEVAKALRTEPTVIAMDEPTSALTTQEVDTLFGVVESLKREGKALVYITHKMEEIFRLADKISVLRDGRLVGTYPAAELDQESLIAKMVGDKKAAQPVTNSIGPGALALDVKDLVVHKDGKTVVNGVSLQAHAGEVVGLAGLQGSGATELMGALYGGYGTVRSGQVRLLGEGFVPRNPKHSLNRGLVLLTNDRKTSGLVMPMTVTENMVLGSLGRLTKLGWRSPKAEANEAVRMVSAMSIKAHSLEEPVASLSGGNQQKVALAKCVLAQPKVLLLDEPTRGIDIGAKREIYELISRWRAEGMAIIVITSELPELLELADRIVVMHRGKAVKEFTRAEATGEKVIEAAMDVTHA